METYKQIQNPDSGKYYEDVLLSQQIRHQVDLNQDVLREILSHADIQSVFQLCQVNKNLCHQHDDLFHRIYQRFYKKTGMDVFKTADMTWFQLLKLCYQLSRLISLLPSLKKYTMKELYTMVILNLSNQKIKVLPTEICLLSHLQILVLNSNELSALPPEIGQLSALQELYVTNNQLSALPPEIGQLSHLQELHLQHNQLSALPPEIGNLSALQQLSLQHNKLSALPPEIGQMSDLYALSLSNNQLSSLPPEITQLSHLEYIYLDNNKLSPTIKNVLKQKLPNINIKL
ncbi:MAG TPA: leucine-rich repeat domain-containing protein [Candidatus Saccharimonadales bacterium]|nr:leucine-rich repeat domain-containing protein [Candidatus Saccharimonadales bacterium]